MPQSGIYEAIHERDHRTPHELVMLAEDFFPLCETCEYSVRFRLVHAAPYIFEDEDFRQHNEAAALPLIEKPPSQTAQAEQGMPAHDARSVLIISHELSLRDTYRLLFYGAGYEAESCEVSRFFTSVDSKAYDVIVFDHTLSESERKLVVQVVRKALPKALTVALHSSGKDCGADLVMDSRDGAAAILQSVDDAIQRRDL